MSGPRALERVKIRVAAISGRIVLAWSGKDENEALASRDAMSEFWHALVRYVFPGPAMPRVGESEVIYFGAVDEQFRLTVERVRGIEEDPHA